MEALKTTPYGRRLQFPIFQMLPIIMLGPATRRRPQSYSIKAPQDRRDRLLLFTTAQVMCYQQFLVTVQVIAQHQDSRSLHNALFHVLRIAPHPVPLRMRLYGFSAA